ncbi:MAG: methyltransferase domain-containing protein [Nitrospinae bacterium]|nr:methyltransferase domain-containing protein [Nitrospinota bacterium]
MQKFRKVITLFDDYYDMMSDRVRMESYRKAVFETVKKGDVVLDLGSGPGILSFFAVQAGAKKVYAVEKMAESINLARQVAVKNGFDSSVVFIHGNSKDIELPEKADVVVSETLGSFALEENTLEFTIDARSRFLKEGGKMVPQGVQLWLAPVSSPVVYKKMKFWQDVYNIDFSPASEEIAKKLLIEDIEPSFLLSQPKCFKDIDLTTVESSTIEGDIVFDFVKSGMLHGFGGWFRTFLTPSISFITSPDAPKTHWRQAFFPLREPISVTGRDSIRINMKIGPKSSDVLSLSKDETFITYNYFCTQEQDTGAPKHQSTRVEERVFKAGRNDPCPCGSGKKYKKCCGV